MHVLPHGTTHPWLQYIQESPLLVRLENCGSSKHCIGLSMVDRAFQPMVSIGSSIHMYICVYIYIYRERESDRSIWYNIVHHACRAFQPMEVTGKSRVVTGGHG